MATRIPRAAGIRWASQGPCRDVGVEPKRTAGLLFGNVAVRDPSQQVHGSSWSPDHPMSAWNGGFGNSKTCDRASESRTRFDGASRRSATMASPPHVF